MNTDNLNKSDLVTLCYRIDDIREYLVRDLTVFDRYGSRYHYLYKVLMRLIHAIHEINRDYTLCVYCVNGIDHNLGDHKLAVERQRVTNENKLWNTIITFHENIDDDFESFYLDWTTS